jgi:predicted ATPase
VLKNLKIKNYRSIVDADISFGGLTVLIGANGSGKSNILKGIKFASGFVTEGLDKIIRNETYFNSIVPKVIADEAVRDTLIKFDYFIEHEEKGKPTKSFNHIFEIKHSPQNQKNRVCDINSESITFIDPFRSTGKPSDTKSFVRIVRDATTNPVKVDIEPQITRENFDDILKWFGLFQVKELVGLTGSAARYEDFPSIYELIFRTGDDPAFDASAKSLIGGELRTLLALVADLTVLRSDLSKIEHYNFFSGHLRRGYAPSPNAELSSSGQNMPSVLKRLSGRSQESINRILSCLSDIAPHIINLDVNENEKENIFIEFVESDLQRKVATFDSSDGTVRALAMMLAIETQPHGTTMIIEEPEQNLHPWAIKYVIDFARKVIAAHNIQIILSTHSEHILACVNPGEVLVVARKPGEGTTAKTLKELRPQSTIEMGDIGSMWVRGLIEGIPS